jgi:DNA-binding NarL/FixJ family response regulator
MNGKPIRILIVDDQTLFRAGLKTLLSTQPDLEVAGEASNGEEALRLTALLRPQVVLMDLRMPVLDGVSATRRIRECFPDSQVIILTTFDDDELAFEGLRAGAIGYLLKDTSYEKLFEAIHAAVRGEHFLQPSITAKVLAEFARLHRPVSTADQPVEALTDREVEVLRMAASGFNNHEIAEHLVLAEGTVKNHLSKIFAKLGVRDRMQAVAKARELGII